MASLQLSSRFELLQVQDTADRDAKRQHRASKSQDKKQESENAKKRAKKKKRQQQLNSERDQLRGMAFMHKTGSSGHGGDAGLSSKSSKNKHTSGSSQIPPHQQSQPSETWKNKDEELVDKRFEEDLEKALLESKVMYEERQTFLAAVSNLPPEDESEAKKEVKKEEKSGNKKEKKNQKKDKHHPMSLQEFHSTTPSSQGVGLDDIEPPEESSPVQLVTQAESPQTEDTFFNDIEQAATCIIEQEHQKAKKKKENKTPQKEENKGEAVRRLLYEDELQKKDEEIKQLKDDFSKLKDELAQVKKRNKQLCVILAQGEMKDKADVLKQVEELTAVRDELTQQVQDLHTALEQERSKVSSLKTELQKLQEKKK